MFKSLIELLKLEKEEIVCTTEPKHFPTRLSLEISISEESVSLPSLFEKLR